MSILFKPFSRHSQNKSKLTLFFAVQKTICLRTTTTKTSLSLTPKKLYSKDPHFLRSFPILSAPFPSLVAGFINTTNRFQSASLTCPTTFVDFGETSTTQKWFRAFITTQSRHVVFPSLEKSLAANIQFFANDFSLRFCSEARPLLQSPVVRSERSRTDELMKFAFATTYRLTKILTRTCQIFFRSAYWNFLASN